MRYNPAKTIVLLLAAVLLLSCTAIAEGRVCPACGGEITGNACSSCGQEYVDTDLAALSREMAGMIRCSTTSISSARHMKRQTIFR